MSTDTMIQAAEYGNHGDEEYAAYMRVVQQRFLENTGGGKGPLFTTYSGDLWSAYIESFADPTERQHHNCNTCRHFITRFGGLVVIDESGVAKSAIWNCDDAPEAYKPAVAAMENLVRRARVTGVFLSRDDVLGTPITGAWRHFAVELDRSAVYRGIALTAGQAMAEKRQDFETISRALAEFSEPHLEQAVALLKSDTLYRGERMLGQAEWLLELKSSIGGAERLAGGVRGTQNQRANRIWRAVATAPAGFCHPRSSMIGTLLEDLAAGMSFEDVSRRFADKMQPSRYQRAQVAPAAGAIEAAERLIASLGVAASLPRRYARLDEIDTLWKPTKLRSKSADGTVFGHLMPKGSAPNAGPMVVPPKPITWEKFRDTVLPTALSIEAQVPSESDRFMALVTAADDSAPPILQWDSVDARNQVSWYYDTGIDAEIRRRLVDAGGRFADCDIRASLIWENRNDLDLLIYTPNGDYIFYGNKRDRCGGELDVDRNVQGETTTPVENTRWPRGRAPAGRYEVRVWNYRYHEPAHTPVPFALELDVGGEVFRFEGEVPAGSTQRERNVVEFIYTPGQRAEIVATSINRVTSSPSSWGLQPGQMVPVTGIALSPNLWGDQPQTHHGRHAFFLLEGCRDGSSGRGRGFFTETLRSELRAARSTLEAYNAQAVITGVEGATACGLGVSASAPMNLSLRVTSKAGVAYYKLDRWD